MMLESNLYTNVTLMPAVQLLVHSSPLAFARGAYSNDKPIPEVHLFSRGIQSSFQVPYCKHEVEVDQPAVFCGALLSHYGHFLLETLAFAWFVKKNKNLLLVFDFSNCNDGLLDYQKQILSILNIETNILVVENPTLFKTLFIPEPGFILNYYCHEFHKLSLGVVKSNIKKGNYLFISRKKVTEQNKRGCTNEHEMEKLLLQYGWDVIFPESMPIHQQLEKISSAEVCLLVEGSAQHTLMLIKNFSGSFFVIPRINNKTYQIIASYVKNYFILDIPKRVVEKKEFRNRDTFEVDIKALEAILVRTSNLTVFDDAPNEYLKKSSAIQDKCELQKIVYSADCTLTKSIRLFYIAIQFKNKKMLKCSFRISLYLLSRKLYEEYMVTRCIENILLYIRFLRLESFKYSHFSNGVLRTIDIVLIELSKMKHYKNVLTACATLCTELANYFRYFDKHELSIYYLELAVNVLTDNLKFYINYVSNLINNLYYEKASEVLVMMIEKFPHSSDTYILTACIHEKKKEFNKALSCVTKAIIIDQNNVKAWEYYFHILLKNGQIDFALSEIDNFKCINPQWDGYNIQKSIVHSHINNHISAIDFAAKALLENACCMKYRVHLCSLFRKQNNNIKARDLMLEGIKYSNNSSEVYLQLAYIDNALGNREDAINWILNGLKIDPKRLKLREVLYNLLISNKENVQASALMLETIKFNPFWNFGRKILKKVIL